MRRVLRRMRAAVHPNGPPLLIRADVLLNRDQPLGLRIFFFPDSQVQGPAINIRNDVNAALMFRYAQTRGIPAQGKLPRAFGDRKTEVVHERWTENALRLVLMKQGCPVSGEIQPGRRIESACGLGDGRNAQEDSANEQS